MEDIKRELGIDMPGVYAVLTKVSLAALVIVPLIALMAFALGINQLGVWIGLSAFVIVEIILLPMSIWLGRAEANRLRKMLQGEYWAHWEYTPAEQEQFSQHETVRTQKDVRFSIG